MNLDLAWQYLKDQCCVNPATATKCVMVSKGDFIKAMERFKAELIEEMKADAEYNRFNHEPVR